MLFGLEISTLDFYYPGFLCWLYFLLPVLATVLWLWPVGLVFGRLFNLQGSTLWAYAPLISLSIITCLTLGFSSLHIPYRPKTAGGLFLVLFLIGLVILKLQGKLVFRGSGDISSENPKRYLLSLFAIVFLACSFRLALVIKAPAAFTQTWDNTFHLAAIQKILETGDGSSLHMSLIPPYTSSFYPATWHDLVALVVPFAQDMSTMATNAVVVVVAFLIWPLGIYSLSKQVSSSPTFRMLTVAASIIIPQFPLAFMWYGTLYPNLLANAFLPVVLNLALNVLRRREQRLSTLFLLIIGVPGLALAQPNAIFSLALLFLFSSAGILLSWIWGGDSLGQTTSAPSQITSDLKNTATSQTDSAHPGTVHFIFTKSRIWASILLGGGVILCLVVSSLLIDQIFTLNQMRRSTEWNVNHASLLDSIKQLLVFTAGRISVDNVTYLPIHLLPVGLLVLFGLYLASRQKQYWWLITAWTGTGIFYVVCASASGTWRSYLGGIWYNDMPRIIVLVVVPAVFLLVLSVQAVAHFCGSLFASKSCSGLATFRSAFRHLVTSLPDHREMPRTTLSVMVGLLILCTLVGPTTQGSFFQISVHSMIHSGTKDSKRQLDDQDELKLFLKAKDIIPPDAVTLGNPWEGASMLWPLAQRQTYPRRVSGAPMGQEHHLVSEMQQLKPKKQVCPILKEKNIQYLLDLRNMYLWGGCRSAFRLLL